MDMSLETPFLKGYERIARHYILVIRSVYKYNHFEDYCTPGVIEKNYNDFSKEVREFTRNAEVEKMYLGDNEDAESSLIWQEVLSNLYEVSSDKLDAYIYFLLHPFVHVLTAFNNESTDEDKYVSKWLIQTVTLGNAEIISQLLDDIADFDDVPLLDKVPFVALSFVSRLIETCNLLGYDVPTIANKFHIPMPRIIYDYNLEMSLFANEQYRIRYFPFFDRRKFDNPSGRGKILTIPPELDTPQAREYLNRAQEAGFVDERYRPIKGRMTKVQMKLFAAYCSAACNITERHWKVFEELWNVKDLQKVKEEQGRPAKAKTIADLFPSEAVKAARDRFNLLL